ncbi:MAG: hypothetical protein DRP78_00460 [Candidatus Omnitrophota bacterium]|nr:MAG: hypothetical protein DRP78_00460 [Candidatus Omnitrophota bacterium]
MEEFISLAPGWAEKLKQIKIVAMDVDGVLTDGGMYYTQQGETMKKFNARDGQALRLLREQGLIVALITGEKNESVLRRAEKLKIKDVYLNARDKIAVAEGLLTKYNLTWKNLLYIGDDWIDVSLLETAGFSCAPLDAMPWAIEKVDFVCTRNGGTGVMGDIYYLLNKVKKGHLA